LKNDKGYRLGIIGCGNMAEAIIKGVFLSGFLSPGDIICYEIKPQRAKYIENNYHVSFADEISQIALYSRNILICVKPGDMLEALNNIKKYFKPGFNSIISIAAGVPSSFIEQVLGNSAPVIRIMPNTPALVNKGMAAISRGKYASDNDMEFAVAVIKSLGEYIIVGEHLQNAVTAISGSGPAYFFLFCKLLIRAAEKRGIDSDTARKLVINTLAGSGELLKNYNPDADFLIKMVASPGGTTQAALCSFDENHLDRIVDEAVGSAEKRAKEIQAVIESGGLKSISVETKNQGT
jgi:pyrroline-5-carboxylate reductase